MINGKDLKNIIEELTKPFNPSLIKKTQDGKDYIDFSCFVSRLDEVVGVLNYSVEYPFSEVLMIGTEQNVRVTARLTVYNDDGTVACIKEGMGAAKVIFPKNENGYSTIPSAFDNVCDSASHDALKRAIKMLGVGKELKQRNKKGKTTASAKPQTSASGKYNLTFVEPLVEMAKKPGAFTAKATDATGEYIKVIFWSDAVDSLSDQTTKKGTSLWQEFMSQCRTNKGVKASVVGERSTFNGQEQIVFASFGA